MCRWILLFASFSLVATPAFPVAVVEKAERVEVDYSAQKIRFYGESAVKPEDGADAIKAAERRARLEGLDYLATKGDKVLPFKAAAVRANNNSYVTNYYADGTVRVYLESSMAGLAAKDLTFTQKDKVDTSASSTSGVIFTVDKKAKPAAVYQIVDESGAILFEAKDVAEAAFQQGLMGRWLQRPGDKDLAAVVGAKPARLSLVSIGPGKFQANRAAWDETMKESRPHLVNGEVALVVP